MLLGKLVSRLIQCLYCGSAGPSPYLHYGRVCWLGEVSGWLDVGVNLGGLCRSLLANNAGIDCRYSLVLLTSHTYSSY